MSDKIKPKMVDGEAVCCSDCDDHWSHHTVHEVTLENMCDNTVCGPYYRARCAELEADVVRLWGTLDLSRDTVVRNVEARAEKAEAEVERLRIARDLARIESTKDSQRADSAETRLEAVRAWADAQTVAGVLPSWAMEKLRSLVDVALLDGERGGEG